MYMKKVVTLSVLAMLSITAINANAQPQPPTIYTDASNTENRVYAGIVFDLDGSDGFVPDVVLGFRSLHVNSSDSVDGADLSARISYGKHDKGIMFDSARLVYVGGERNVMGNIGIGYSNTHASFIGTAAIQGPYTRIGSDFEFGKNKFEPFLEINTLDKANNVDKTATLPLPG
jgi:hypothetical protein